MNLCSEKVAGWPPLAWIAQFSGSDRKLRLLHGQDVHVGDHWFGEAVWDGPFEDADFDQTDLVFGSGARQRDGQWIFVSSATTVDRLVWHRGSEGFTVSNSLACLTSYLDAEIDPHRRDYFEFFESIIRGIDAYDQVLETSVGPAHLVYFRNLQFDGDELIEVEKRVPKRDLSTFHGYEDFLIESMKAIGDNIADPDRSVPIQPIASLSTGYDSPTVATVARFAGLKETISIADARGGDDDDGARIAEYLGLAPLSISRDRWRNEESENAIDPTRYIASDAKGEDVFMAPAAELFHRRVLFSGYSGSRVWDATVADYANIRRGDQSGLSHTEARLHAGYLHVPVPFFAALQENDIRAIGRQIEMKDWSIGGNYDRPVCRRIVEEAGVPRELFGQSKKAASVLFFDRHSFLPERHRQSLRRWIDTQRIGQRNAVEAFQTFLGQSFGSQRRRALRALRNVLVTVDQQVKLPVIGRLAKSGRVQQAADFEPGFDHLFPWALSATQEAYRGPLAAHQKRELRMEASTDA